MQTMLPDIGSDGPNPIVFLFHRMCEPVWIPKGPNNVFFDIPSQFIPERYRSYAEDISNRWDSRESSKILVNQVEEPDLTIPLQLGRYETFTLFIPEHRKIAGRLIDVFMGMKSLKDLLGVAACCRDTLNPYLFVYCLSVALIHRGDTKNIQIPPLCEIFPAKFLDRGIILRAKEEANLIQTGSRIPIVLPMDNTGSDMDEEHRVAYWREDIRLNLHHWHWHLVYPFEGEEKIVKKDRRGELFYYMHQQMLARYNCERFCNNLGRAKKLNNLREVINEGYYPKLDSLVASRTWTGRSSGLYLQDLNRPADKIQLEIGDLERWRDRILMAIHSGVVINNGGERLFLTEVDGIDVLGNMIEASILTPNKNFYGDLHNQGHNAISYIHDPDGRHQETFGVMGDPATAMRDPIFYRWHAFINDIFLEHKATLPEYSVENLSFPGISITNCEIVTPNSPPNMLITYWDQVDTNLSMGLDFQPQGNIYVRTTILNHLDYRYDMTIMNSNISTQSATVRIFMSPKVDERGLPFTFRVQKDLMIEMDKFLVTLKPGSNLIKRNSIESALTIVPIGSSDPEGTPAARPPENNGTPFCGCGWPHHLLVPKGKLEGYPMELFVMITNSNDDLVTQYPADGCSVAASYCGIRDRKYPDARSMGYPFDRKPRDGVETLAEFLTPNMVTVDVEVRHRKCDRNDLNTCVMNVPIYDNLD